MSIKQITDLAETNTISTECKRGQSNTVDNVNKQQAVLIGDFATFNGHQQVEVIK